MQTGSTARGSAKGRATRRLLPVLLLLVFAAGFAALGIWQVQRLAWKEALIADVARALRAAPVPPEALPRGDLAALTYHRVVVNGVFDPRGVVLATATSPLGNGYWVMVPVSRGAAPAIWVNRGFVPLGTRLEAARAAVPTGPVRVVGLVRQTEPRGTLLRANRPEQERWYARDLSAMTIARRLPPGETRYFLDAQTESPAPTLAPVPVPGLTVVQFPNNHLAYALTWFALAGLSLAAIFVVVRKAR